MQHPQNRVETVLSNLTFLPHRHKILQWIVTPMAAQDVAACRVDHGYGDTAPDAAKQVEYGYGDATPNSANAEDIECCLAPTGSKLKSWRWFFNRFRVEHCSVLSQMITILYNYFKCATGFRSQMEVFIEKNTERLFRSQYTPATSVVDVFRSITNLFSKCTTQRAEDGLKTHHAVQESDWNLERKRETRVMLFLRRGVVSYCLVSLGRALLGRVLLMARPTKKVAVTHWNWKEQTALASC